LGGIGGKKKVASGLLLKIQTKEHIYYVKLIFEFEVKNIKIMGVTTSVVRRWIWIVSLMNKRQGGR